MNLDEIKRISIISYLASIGCLVKQDFGHYGKFLSPFRKERSPSLKVDYNENLWYDFGIREGGDNIKLVRKVENCSYNEAVNRLKNNSNSFSFHCQDISVKRKVIRINKIKKLENRALLQYLTSRRIDLSIAQQYCKEIYYQVGDSRYFSIGFENENKDYETRSEPFKGCIGKKAISHLKNNSKTLYVFEGFINFLSWLTLKKYSIMLSFDVIVLNGVTNSKKAKPKFKDYETINLFLDNDSAGQQLTKEILSEFQQALDYSHYYSDYNDLNDFLQNR